jgi:hypothetical protein
MWGLLHDASEAYVTDVPRPIKPHLNNYKELEALNMNAICRRFNLELPEPAEVKDIDNRIVTDEKLQNMKKPPVEWDVNFEPLGVKLEFWDPTTAKKKFLLEYGRILREMNNQVAA